MVPPTTALTQYAAICSARLGGLEEKKGLGLNPNRNARHKNATWQKTAAAVENLTVMPQLP
jgi:hypothetical protein